ncbi:peptidylprolyl isomerase [Parerythrobacter jejuensis]|uniref:Peptidyl-prolyl cis-trans isomerase n=1 Tax=Parerythrobacter jejuensis TaxID=795812 RepID=A0A845ARP1_9SPHN|nr:peptidylprolyl isomerase [Parerythrobacter jejuensis]MXP32264.1 peptidylprolyl isomerase [Parerythrobacter jejuensis]
MTKRILAAGALAALVTSPTYAQDEGDVAVEDAMAAPAERAPLQYAKINYDVQEDRDNILLLDLSNGERIAIRLMPDWAPGHVDRVKTLTRQGFYDGIVFHRVIEGFMAQTGDPTGTGQGGSSLPDLQAEFNPMPHVRGSVSMARSNSEDSANSQFFLVFYPRFNLDKRYTNFGRVISNMAAVDAIQRGEPPANPTRIVQASIASDNKPQAMPQPAAPEREITLDDLTAPIEG